QPAPGVAQTASIFEPHRENSKGFDLHDDRDLEAFYAARAPFAEPVWDEGTSENQPVINPARPADRVGSVSWSNPETVPQIVRATRPWMEDASARALKLRATAALYEKHAGEIFALLAREAGKTPKDAVAELREAVDFLYYYAGEAERLADAKPIGRFACVSPWNFPLAIFTGQIAAALAAGNAVIAKPAEETPLIAQLAVSLLYDAGIPSEALQLVQGDGAVGAALIGCPEIGGVCFTGSTQTAQAINRTMAQSLSPAAPLIAETGGLNAMIVDSTALPEQAVRDIVASAFQSAGQRCSALRILYVQDDIADGLLQMLYGAMDELTVGDPWHLATDVGPIIHEEARADIQAYIDEADTQGRVLKSGPMPDEGTFVAPTVIEVSGIADMSREIFGPVLHVSRFKADKLPKIVDDINARGFGLTFGLHTRIDDRVEMIASKVRAGNIYINRNQIGAIVASQPFGGEGLSGTGPKAGGPHYVRRFAAADRVIEAGPDTASFLDFNVLEAALRALPIPPQNPLETIDLPGPTGESNRLSTYPRGRFLCLGLTAKAAKEQVALAKALGNSAIGVAPGASGDGCIDGAVDPEHLKTLNGFDAVAMWADDETLRPYGAALAARPGKLILLTTSRDFTYGGTIERHLCVDTTASGGNASLLAAAE
ncbi:MAG: L-glutamate gamma-semialdehyde dehydrogenase, partial [Pseudomonadota bacterium]